MNSAQIFNKKNTAIAHKFGLAPDLFDFYMIENYQKYLNLIGINYQVYENVKYRTGKGVSFNIIFQ